MFDAGRPVGLAFVLLTVSFVGCAGPGPSDAEQVRSAAEQAVGDLSTPSAALEAGYEPDPFCSPDEGVHWINDDLLDGEIDPARPEALLFLPTGDDVASASPGAQRFLGVSYILAMDDEEAAPEEPSVTGVPMDGPKPGHTPNMPRHAELHVYLDRELELDEPFPAKLRQIDCPPETTPPGAQDEPSDPSQARAEPASCEEVMTGRRTHEHARIEVYLGEDRPYDFSPERYQLADRSIHFEAGERDAGGAIIHVHESGATLGCMLETLGWSLDSDRLYTDTGEAYVETDDHEFEVFVNGERTEERFDVRLRDGNTYVLRYNSSAPPTPCPGLGGPSVHQHAQLEVYLNDTEPWDFSAPRYQNQGGSVAFEDGRQDADGARIHVHEERPSLGCLFATLGWETSQHRVETDAGHVFEATEESPIEVLVDGEPAPQGFDTPIERAHSYEVRYNATANDTSNT